MSPDDDDDDDDDDDLYSVYLSGFFDYWLVDIHSVVHGFFFG